MKPMILRIFCRVVFCRYVMCCSGSGLCVVCNSELDGGLSENGFIFNGCYYIFILTEFF